jgi:3-dehydroquinate dehydratase/shikimate dehydrogenase
MAIVVSHLADSFDALVTQVRQQEALADLIEVRLDRIGHPGKARLAELFRAVKKPVIVACHGTEAFGEADRDPDELCDLLHDCATAGARFVDVDWRLALELGEVPAPCHRIVSRHELAGTPEDLGAVHEEVAAVLGEGDVTKIVTHAESCEDGLRLLRWLRTTKGVIGFCSGTAGRFTRLLAPIFGSPFTYCAPAAFPGQPARPTAPGQWPVNDLVAAAPPGGLNQGTAILGVVGRPIGHSLSPRVQGLALKAARLDAVFVALEPATLGGLLALADDENWRGFAVTAPFKEEALASAVRADEAATRTGAANTLLRERDGWRAANTDVAAVRETLASALHLHARRQAGAPRELARARVLVLGAGGAARAAVWAARALEAEVVVAGRTRARAEAVAGALGARAVGWDEIPNVDHDVLVHTTPVGTGRDPGAEDALPIPAGWIRPGTLVLDAVYRPIRTALLAAASARDCTAVPGAEWFVRQAEAQFRLFTHGEPDVELMRHTLETALAQTADA